MPHLTLLKQATERFKKLVVLALLVAFFIAYTAPAEDWPTFMHDNQRNGVSHEQLALPLHQAWTYMAKHSPQPAWPEPAKQDFWHRASNLSPAVTYDRAFQLVAVGNTVFFGSSAADKVYALDAETGRTRWSFFTEGPVRLAPTVFGGKVLVGSDDGCVYCLDAIDGELLWKRKLVERDYFHPGNGRIISLWPVRSGVLVVDDTAYCAAGLFPSQGVHLFALNVADGAVQWRQAIEFSSQGHLLASADHLFVPTGRTGPAMFDRGNGDYLGRFKGSGGSFALVVEDKLLNGPGIRKDALSVSDTSNQENIAAFSGLRILVDGGVAYLVSRHNLSALDRTRYIELGRQLGQLEEREEYIEDFLEEPDNGEADQDRLRAELQQINMSISTLKSEMKQCTLWRRSASYPYSLVMAGKVLFAGGQDAVAAFSAVNGEELWKADVDGEAYSLAVANGRLFVSTNKGVIYCFSGGPATKTYKSGPLPVADPFPEDSLSSVYSKTAKYIVDRSGTTKGYCLVLGSGEGRLAYELARLTDLRIVGVEEDAAKVAAARAAIDKAGLYGRVVIHHGALVNLPYIENVANLIVSDQTLASGELPGSVSEIYRVLRPYGGTLIIGQPQERLRQQPQLSVSVLQSWVENPSIPGWKIDRDDGLWLMIRRGPLSNAGEWTHQYADAGNTACSMDRIVKGQMAVQWFGPPGPREMIDRHHRNVAPLYKDGRLFAPGDCVVFALDAYNGTLLWDARIPNSRRLGVFLDSSNMVVDDERLYVVAEDKCHRFDVQTGEPFEAYTMPQLIEGEPREWGYIAYRGDVLFGSGHRQSASYTETSWEADNALWRRNMKLVTSDYLFGMERNTGKVLWTYTDGLVINTTLTVGNDRLYFIETHSPKALADRLGRMPVKTLFDSGQPSLVVLDSQTGRVVYKKPIEVDAFEEPVYLSHANRVLVLSGSRAVGETLHYTVYALDAPTGKTLWKATHDSGLEADDDHGQQNRHPTIVGETVYAWPFAYNLRTGEQVEGWEFDRRGHGCGGVSASAQALFWRGDNPWMYDLSPDGGPIRLNNVTRPGCWINIIPAGGLVLIPEYSSGCTCSYPMQTSMAFAPIGHMN